MPGKHPSATHLGYARNLVPLAPGKHRKPEHQRHQRRTIHWQPWPSQPFIVQTRAETGYDGQHHHNFPNSITWWTNTVGSAADSYKSWFDAEESNDKSWRARRDLHESKWLNLFADVVSESYTTGPPRLQSRPARPQVMLCRCRFRRIHWRVGCKSGSVASAITQD